MAETTFDAKQMKAFLKRTGEEIRKTGQELRDEAQKLLGEVSDPHHAQRVKDSLTELGQWFKKSTTDAAEAIEAQVKRAEATLFSRAQGVSRKATSKKTAARRVALAAKRAGSQRPSAAKKQKSSKRSTKR